MSAQSQPILVVGVGNADRGDDAVGIAVARRVCASAPPHVAVHEQDGSGGALVELLQSALAPTVILIDAMASGAPPGSVQRFEVQDAALPASFHLSSSHLFGIAEGIELARVMGWLPPRMIVYGVEGADYTWRSPLSAAVSAAVEQLAARVGVDLRMLTA